jgi:chorismate mutase
MGGAGQHKDKKKAEKQGSVKHKKSYMESLRTQIDQLKSKLAEQGVAEGSGANKTHLAMAYLKAVVMAPIGTPEKRRILNWQQILSNQFDIEMDPDTLAQMLPQFDSQLQSGNLDKLQNRMASRGELEIGESEQGVAEAPEDRTSYQVAKILSDRGIKYDPAQENELINAIGMVLVKELNMSPKEARYLISYDEDFVSDTLGELRSMEQSVSEVDVYMESLAHSLQQVLSEKAVSKQQQKFMGMVHAAQKGEKPASKEVAKVAKDMGKKDAKDFASTKHKGLPEKKKSKK